MYREMSQSARMRAEFDSHAAQAAREERAEVEEVEELEQLIEQQHRDMLVDAMSEPTPTPLVLKRTRRLRRAA